MRIRKLVVALCVCCLLCSSISVSLADDVTPVRGGSIVVSKVSKWSTLNLIRSNSRAADLQLLSQIYEALLRLDSSDNVIPGLATAWEFVDDRTLVMTLRQGVLFHDGTPFNAEAAKACLDWYISDGLNPVFISEIKELQSIDVLDEYKIQLNLTEPSSVLISALANLAGFMISPNAIAQGEEYLAANPCGTGPFIVKEAIEGDHITLVRNENYYMLGVDGLPLPYLDQVTMKIITDDSVTAANLISGDVVLTDYLSTDAADMIAASKADVSLMVSTAVVQWALFLKVADERLANADLRRAITCGINKEELAAVLGGSEAVVTPFCVLKDQWFYDDYEPYPYNPERAKELLVAAGYPDGVTLEMQYISREFDARIAQLIQAQLAQIGITLVLEPMERSAYLAMFNPTNSEGCIGLANLGLPRIDPYVQFYNNMGLGSSTNYSAYAGELYNEILDKIKTTLDLEVRKDLHSQAQKAFLDDAAAICLFQVPKVLGISNKLHVELTRDANWILREAWMEK